MLVVDGGVEVHPEIENLPAETFPDNIIKTPQEKANLNPKY